MPKSNMPRKHFERFAWATLYIIRTCCLLTIDLLTHVQACPICAKEVTAPRADADPPAQAAPAAQPRGSK